MNGSIAVTDGLIRVHSRGPSAIADVLIGDRRTPAWIGYEADGRSDDTSAALVRCEFPEPALSPGHAGRAMHLLLHHLATRTEFRSAILRIKPADANLLGIAVSAGFSSCGTADGELLLTRPVPPVRYGDGVVTIRPQRIDDIDRHMEAIDDDQIDWLWLPGSRQEWEAMTAHEQRERNVKHLRACQEDFGKGPVWTFSADLAEASYVAYVDCDLANIHVPPGEANISYTGHPVYRGQGHVSRAVRLVTRFLCDHTGAGSAHIIVDAANTASLRVAHAVGAVESERWIDEYGRTMVRHVRPLR
jgi:RimJ/RimL family protein N-acetyltransferase